MKMFNVSSREFTHRVKSVSMAKFTSQEVNALQEGGNQVCVCVSSEFLEICVIFFLSAANLLNLSRARLCFPITACKGNLS